MKTLCKKLLTTPLLLKLFEEYKIEKKSLFAEIEVITITLTVAITTLIPMLMH